MLYESTRLWDGRAGAIYLSPIDGRTWPPFPIHEDDEEEEEEDIIALKLLIGAIV